jgi:putative ABC transport system substrate-binding protein
MRRREFITLLGGVATAWPLAARAQQAGETLLVGILETISRQLNAANFAAFVKGLRELGFVEGQNLRIEYRSADGRTERFPTLANELVKLNVDVIVTRGTPAAFAAKMATNKIPIVMAANGDPLGNRLIASLARPGGNITGLSALVTDLYRKRVQLLHDSIAPLRRIVGFFNMQNPQSASEWAEVLAGARSFGIETEVFDVRSRDALTPAFDAANRKPPDAAVVGLDTLTQSNAKLIADLATQHRLPTIYASREFVEAGGLLSYGVSYPDLYYRAATYVDQIRKGRKPSDLPVQQATKFELVVNLKAAKALGLNMSRDFLLLADDVIE